jgi:transposase-like protein
MKTGKKRERDQWDELLDKIDFKGLGQEAVPGQGGLLKQPSGRLLQKAREAEMAEHPGYGKHDSAGDSSGGIRNGTFEPAILPKYQKRVPLFNGQTIPMYSFGMANRDIKSRLEQVYNADVPPELISRGTDAVMEDAGECRAGLWKRATPSCVWTRCG